MMIDGLLNLFNINKMIKYNIDKLIKVSCSDFAPSIYYTYKKRKTFLWFTTLKEGIYDDYLDYYYGNNVPEQHVLIDGVVYEKPTVVLYFQDGHTKEYYFENYDNAKIFAEKYTTDGNWL